MDGSLKIGRVLGIPLGIHQTWLIAFILVAWSLAAGYFPFSYPGWAPETYWIAGIVAALLLFVSVLIHELSHAIVARWRGLRVRGITLFVFGGVSSIEGEAAHPLDEFLIAVVGPITSVLIALIAWVASGAVHPDTGVAYATLAYLATANAILAAFNIIPGFPLDGGRVLRAIVWGASGSLATATNVSSYVGQVIAYGLIAWGIIRMFAGDFLGGLWIAFIGWFLSGAAETSRHQLALQNGFRGIRVAELMTPDPDVVPPTMLLDTFVREEVIRRGHRTVPVLDGDRLLGVISITDAQKVSGDQWTTTPVSTVMTARDLAVVAPGDDVERGLKLMVERDLHQVLVVDDSRLVGILTRSGVIQFLTLHERFGLRARAAEQPPAVEGRLRPVA